MQKRRTPVQVFLAGVPHFLGQLANDSQGIAPVPFTGGRLVVVSKPEYVQAVLSHKNATLFGKGGWAEKQIAKALGPRGLFLTNDIVWWAHLRQVMNPAFARTAMELVAQSTVAALETRMRNWTDSQPVDLFEEFKRVSIEVLMRHLFGTSASNAEIAELSRLADPVFEGMAWQVFMPKWLPGGMGYHQAIRRLEAKLYPLISRRRSEYLANPDQSASDLLWRLVTSESPRYSAAALRDQVFTLLMAGFDSTAAVLCAAARELAFNSHTLELLRAELQEVTTGKPVTLQHLPHLTKLDEFVDATLHKHPAFPAYFREVKQECRLGSYVLKPGTQLVIGLHAMHHMHDFDRDHNDQLVSIPFGHGPRMCIAESMATITMKLVLGRMLQRYSTWTRVDPTDERMIYAMTWRYFNTLMYLSA